MRGTQHCQIASFAVRTDLEQVQQDFPLVEAAEVRQALLLLANLESVADALAAGAVVAIGRRGIRVRRLPLR